MKRRRANCLTNLAKDICREGLDGPFHRACRSLLDEGKITYLVRKMKNKLPRSGPRRKAGLVQIRYFHDNAPAMRVLNVHPDKIRDVIGKGGVTIRSITEETGCTIDIADDPHKIVDDVIKSRGEKVSPKEVENVLCQHPAVAEAAVVGRPHDLKGQAIAAFVTIRDQDPSEELRQE